MVFRILFYLAVFYDDLIRQLRDKELPDPEFLTKGNAPDIQVVLGAPAPSRLVGKA